MISSAEELKGTFFKSIPLSNLKRLLNRYHKAADINGNIWSRALAQHFKHNKIWPPLHDHKFFSSSAPYLALSYMWCGTPMSEIIELLTEHYGGETTVWIDVFFNDQRTPETIQNAVRSANSIYRDAPDHAIIMAMGDYDGVLCLPWDRCWIVNELAIRDVLSVKMLKLRPSTVFFGKNAAAVVDHLRTLSSGPAPNFFDEMKGFGDDPEKIRENLVPSFYSSKIEFNQSFHQKLKDISRSMQANGLVPVGETENGAHHSTLVRIQFRRWNICSTRSFPFPNAVTWGFVCCCIVWTDFHTMLVLPICKKGKNIIV